MKQALVLMAVAAAALGAAAQDALLMSGSQELKLDFSEAQASIQKMARKLKPMTEKMSAGSQEIERALGAVKEDPNLLNKARFEKALADHMRPVMGNIDTVLESELEMQCALEDVAAEVKRVALRIRQDSERNADKEKAIREQLKEQVKELQKLAAEVAAGEGADPEKVRRLRQLQQQVDLGEKQLKLQQQVVKQLQGATRALATSSDNLLSASGNAQAWFANLASTRQAFRDLIRMRMDMANIASMGTAGAGRSLNEMLSALGKAMEQINGVGNLLAQMGGTMDSMESFYQNVEFEVAEMGGPGAVDARQLANDILDKDFSWLK